MRNHLYHSLREHAEEAMTARASSLEARIAYSKLAVLHGKSADRAVTAAMRALQGEAPLATQVEL